MKRILAVDEEPHITNLIKLTLNQRYSIDVAKSTREALGLIKKNKYVCIISEILLPGINGYELCNTIKNNPKTKDTPFIFLTMNDVSMNDRLHMIDMGADDHMMKPFDPTELIRRVNENIKNGISEIQE